MSSLIILTEEDDSLAELSDLSVILVGLFQTTLLLGMISAVYKLPGHDGGGLWPIYVNEHYSLQTSQVRARYSRECVHVK